MDASFAGVSSGGEMERSLRLTFHGVDYVLTVSSQSDEFLSIELEQDHNSLRWRGDFSAEYIEDITRKTGNYKRFGVFLKMLLSALEHSSDSVSLDLLTVADLEMLKTRKLGGRAAGSSAAPGHPTVSSSISSATSLRHSNKRYLILTYRVEYDRVHYPLPLSFEDVPTTSSLERIIRRLRKELTTQKDRADDAVNAANEAMASAAAAAAGSGGDGSRDDRVALFEAQRQIADLKDRLVGAVEQRAAVEERLRNEHNARTGVEKQLAKVKHAYHEKMVELQDENGRLHEGVGTLRAKVRDLTKQLAMAKVRPASTRPGARTRNGRTPTGTSASSSTLHIRSTRASRLRSRSRSRSATRTAGTAPASPGRVRTSTQSARGSLSARRTRTPSPSTRSTRTRPVAGGRSPFAARLTRRSRPTSHRRARSRGSVSSLASGSDSDASQGSRRSAFSARSAGSARSARSARSTGSAGRRRPGGGVATGRTGRNPAELPSWPRSSRSGTASSRPKSASRGRARGGARGGGGGGGARSRSPATGGGVRPPPAVKREAWGSRAGPRKPLGTASRPPQLPEQPPPPASKPQVRLSVDGMPPASMSKDSFPSERSFQVDENAGPPPVRSDVSVQQVAPVPPAPVTPPRAATNGGEEGGGDGFDPQSEIHDIDTRLQALQQFLDEARGATGEV